MNISKTSMTVLTLLRSCPHLSWSLTFLFFVVLMATPHFLPVIYPDLTYDFKITDANSRDSMRQ